MTFREAARRAVEEGIAPSMSHQRVSQLSARDGFPPVLKVGSSKVVDWVLLRPFLIEHARKAALRDSRRRIESEESAGQ